MKIRNRMANLHPEGISDTLADIGTFTFLALAQIDETEKKFTTVKKFRNC